MNRSPAAPLSAPCRLLLLLLCSLALAACSEGGDAPASMPVPAVDVVTLRAEPVALIRELPGRAAASQIAEVRPQVGGIVKARLFEEGSQVDEGQPLYQLDDATYRADLASAQAALQRAEATLAASRLRARRAAELVRINAISAQDNETAIADQQQAAADVAAARAALQRVQLDVDYARIRSPIAGRIGTSSVTQGALVTANQSQPLATVQRLDPMHVDINAPVEDLMQFRRDAAQSGFSAQPEGIPVDIVLPDGSRHPHKGRVEAADLSVDPATGSFTLRVVVPNAEQTLLPGMYVRTVAELGIRADAVLAPQRAIARDPKGEATALVVLADGTVEQRRIVTARAIGDRWLVESGLQAGDRVIVSGLQRVRPGMQVDATDVAAPAEAAPEAAETGDAAPAEAATDADASDAR